MTTRLYYTDRSLRIIARVTGVQHQPGGTMIELDQTIFCPKGGGQQSDQGTIGGHAVTGVQYHVENSIGHTVADDCALTVGDDLELVVDGDRRLLNSRLHSAGHLVAQVTEQLLIGSIAAQGHHWPGESRVEIDVKSPDCLEDLVDQIAPRVADLIRANRTIVCSDGANSRRVVTIEGFHSIECGGTHVRSLGEIGGIQLRNVKLKKGRLRIGYDCC